MNKIAIVSLLSLLSITGCGLVNIKTGFNTEKCLQYVPGTQTCMQNRSGKTPEGIAYLQSLKDAQQAKQDAELAERQQQEEESKRLQAGVDEYQRQRHEEALALEAEEKAKAEAEAAVEQAKLDEELNKGLKVCVEWATKNRCHAVKKPYYTQYRSRLTGATWVETDWDEFVTCQNEKTMPENCSMRLGKMAGCVDVNVNVQRPAKKDYSHGGTDNLMSNNYRSEQIFCKP